MREALKMDPSPDLAGLREVLFAPAEDEFYYRGLGHQAAGRRLPAIANFRGYLERAPRSPWARQVADHLARLGATWLLAEDIQISGQGTVDRIKLARSVLAASPRLVDCLGGAPSVRVQVKIALRPARGAGRPAPPTVLAAADGPTVPPKTVVDCVAERAKAAALPAATGAPVYVDFSVIAR